MATLEATILNVTETEPSGKVVNQNLNFANPEVADSKLAQFALAWTALSDNTLTNLEKTQKSNIDINQD